MISRTSPVDLAAKRAFLGRPESYPGEGSGVEVIETHMSIVFLTDDRVYKLKKPVRLTFLDFSTLEARRRACHEEVRLNRRLAPDVYLGTTPLTADTSGELSLGGEGEPVDWLVVMRRLPREGLLDRALIEGRATEEAVGPVARLLVAFYAGAPPEPLEPEEYVARLRDEADENRRELLTHDSRVLGNEVRDVSSRLETFLEREAPLLQERVRQGKVIEGHGDLRPEHIHLGPPPAVIDCLEFKRSLRILDPVDELAFLSLECERLGGPEAGAVFLRIYRESTGDAPTDRLLAFYAAHRGLLRARIAMWHVANHVPDPARWTRRCNTFIELAATRARTLERRPG